jgi:uncharacterized membrane protein YidH (DUF202 family)
MQSVQKIKKSQTIWELFFPPSVSHFNFLEKKSPPVKASHSPGIWGTSGLALERTLLAERRNVMSRLRTVFARSRTGLAFIRTGVTISALGSGLVAYYGTGNIPWAIFDISLIFSGGLFISNGLYWHLPTEKIKKQYPYCFDDLEITLPEYNKPVKLWKKVIVDHANQ